MNSTQERKLSMYITVREFLTQFLAILNQLPNFQPLFTAFQNVITQIQNADELQGFDRSGNAATKNLTRATLVTLAADTARKQKAYATNTNNQVLLNEMDISESDLKDLADTSLRDKAQGIYNRAQTNLANLAPYLITAATQTALQAAITNFSSWIGKPKIGRVEITQATQQLLKYFESGDATLKNLDAVVDIVRLTQPNFYNGYKSVRKQDKTGRRTLAIKGSVIDAATGAGLRGVKITLVPDTAKSQGVNGSAISIEKKSAVKGGFVIKKAAEGTYTVTIELPGYASQTATISVVAGQMSTLNIKLEKI